MHVQYGIGKPNTLGFMPGASERTIQATFDGSDVLTLRSSQLAAPLRLLKIGDWIFHLLESDDGLMVGNGGYSYTLNRQTAPAHTTQNERLNLFSGKFMHRADSVMTFDGRTPCQPFGQDYLVSISSSCLKIKWRLILHTTPASGKPAGFRLINRAMSPKEIVGNWSVDQRGNTEVLKLDSESHETLQFLFIDPNVLFMLDQQRNLLVGNEHFSFTLNRVK